MRPISALIGIFISLAALQPCSAADKVPPAIYHRTAFLGDSITDGDTYPQLVRQALADADLPAMIAINAGIGGDTAKGMRDRLERDVLAFHPTLVFLSVGANDAMHNVSGDSYAENVGSIALVLRQAHIPLILLTPNIMGPKAQPRGQKNLDLYEKILRAIAHENNDGLRVAEVNQRQKQGLAAGRAMLAPDDIHPNWDGQKMIARAVLDAMGYGDVKVPDEIANRALPGVISPWWVKAIGPKEPALTEEAAGQIKPDVSWTILTPPERESMDRLDADNHWLDGYRAQGASVFLNRHGSGKYIGVASISSDNARKVQFHTGADLEQVWLNGKLIYQNSGRRGYHIGRESVTGELKVGENAVVIRTGPVFFLSVTDGAMWE